MQQVAERAAGASLQRVELECPAVTLARLHLLGTHDAEVVTEVRERRGLRGALERCRMQEGVVRGSLLVPAALAAG